MKKNTLNIYPLRNAFTMMELVFVIVVLGILAAIALPRLEEDHAQEAADHILSNLRYTQHLALNDDKHMANHPQWQRRFWTMAFATCSDGTKFFRIGSDDDMSSGQSGVFDNNETATDPFNGRSLGVANNANCDTITASENIKIGEKYGINSVTGGGACAGIQHIGFDHLGRPHVSFGASNTPDHTGYMLQQCTFTFNMDNGDSFQINIEPETGYAWIAGQEDS